MSEKDFDNFNENEFEEMIKYEISEIPPGDSLTQKITPWKKATERILLGMAISTITFNFLLLNHILPTIGSIMMLLGFRTLRQENKGFKVGYCLSVIDVALQIFACFLNATALTELYQASLFSTVISALGFTTQILIAICVCTGFSAVKRKTGLTSATNAAPMLVFVLGVMFVLALLEYQGIVLGYGIIITYILVIRSLFKLSKELDEAGYSISCAPVKVSDKTMYKAYAAAVFAVIIIGLVFFRSYPMNWQPYTETQNTEVQEIKADLAELGFPENILEDLTDEDILDCKGATFVLSGKNYYAFDNRTNTSAEKELVMTGIAVKLAGEHNEWRIFSHFCWITEPSFYGTEAVKISPPYRDMSDGFIKRGEPTGRVLYDRENETFVSPFSSLTDATYQTQTFFSGSTTTSSVFAAFSFPQKGENYRGYVSYSMACPYEKLADCWSEYAHQLIPVQYPVKTAKQFAMGGSNNSSIFEDFLFDFIQDQFLFSAESNGGVLW